MSAAPVFINVYRMWDKSQRTHHFTQWYYVTWLIINQDSVGKIIERYIQLLIIKVIYQQQKRIRNVCQLSWRISFNKRIRWRTHREGLNNFEWKSNSLPEPHKRNSSTRIRRYHTVAPVDRKASNKGQKSMPGSLKVLELLHSRHPHPPPFLCRFWLHVRHQRSQEEAAAAPPNRCDAQEQGGRRACVLNASSDTDFWSGAHRRDNQWTTPLLVGRDPRHRRVSCAFCKQYELRYRGRGGQN